MHPRFVRIARLLPLVLLPTVAGCYWRSGPEVDPVAEFVIRLDEERRAIGCARSLLWDDSLEEIARLHTTDMRTSMQVRHVNASGEDVGDRLARGGVVFRFAAENLAAGPVRGRRAFQLWYDSPGHRANMLNCLYTHHAVVYDGAYWTHVLVRYTP